ncbi:hypothetical protein [Oceanobacillus arenosus]|uniref:hypothetical protein n=1 Tax=Oceanobacillus arenosus TaxID=1229153 RepID=UPI001FECA320|nr:hypothetical protein [Oceanobacillus arenosus]
MDEVVPEWFREQKHEQLSSVNRAEDRKEFLDLEEMKRELGELMAGIYSYQYKTPRLDFFLLSNFRGSV